jgi:hypothetical protein
MDTEFRLGKMKRFWRGVVVMAAKQHEHADTTESHTEEWTRW